MASKSDVIIIENLEQKRGRVAGSNLPQGIANIFAVFVVWEIFVLIFLENRTRAMPNFFCSTILTGGWIADPGPGCAQNEGVATTIAQPETQKA